MDGEDKKTRVVKPAHSTILRKKLEHLSIYALGLLAAVGLVVLCVHLISSELKNRRNDHVVSSVKTLENGKHTCDQGVKQFSSDKQAITNTDKYSVSAREAALKYLVPCEFMTGNKAQALSDAAVLDKLYAQDGSKGEQERADLQQFVTYIKSYQQ